MVTWVIENPDKTGQYNNQLKITENRANNTSRDFTYAYDSQSSSWTLTDSDNTRTVVSAESADGSSYFRTILNDTTTVEQVQRSYAMVGGQMKLQQVIEGEGAATQTTQYSYYPDNSAYGPNANQLYKVEYPDGRWEVFEYNSDQTLANKYSAWKDGAAPANFALPQPGTFKLTTYDYSPLPGSDDSGEYEPRTPRTTRTMIPVWNGTSFDLQEVSRDYLAITVRAAYAREEQRCADLREEHSYFGSPSNLRTVRAWYNAGSDPNEQGRPKYVVYPDGTATLYSYPQVESGTWHIEQTGQPDNIYYPSAIAGGRQVSTLYNSLGAIVSRVTQAIIPGTPPASMVLAQETYSYSPSDPLQRSYTVTDLGQRVTSYAYGCCGLDTMQDADGVVTSYAYDALKREVGSTVAYGTESIQYAKTLDGAGRLLEKRRISDGSAQRFSYDVLGRLMRETNALEGVTVHTNRMLNNRLYVTNTYPDLGTRVESYFRDGRLESVSGTAAFPVHYEYGIEQDPETETWHEFTLEIKTGTGANATNEWTKTYMDAVGRACRTLYAKAVGPYPFRQSWYNSKGQLWREQDPDGVVMLYDYNAQGEREYSITALAQATRAFSDYDIFHSELASLTTGYDRITQTTKAFLPGDQTAPDIVRTETTVWPQDTSGTGKVVARNDTTPDGLRTWQTVWLDSSNPDTAAVTCTETSACDPETHVRTTTITYPDGTSTLTSYSFGRLASVVRRDTAPDPVASTTYGYDAQGCQYLIIDGRNGATTLTFNPADQVISSTSPDPGSGAQVTTTFYDKMGRITGIRYPDGAAMTNSYYATGLLLGTSGSRTYPAGYAYDTQGRMLYMTNWQNAAHSATREVTRWNYDPYRGWLASKDYPDKNSGNPPAVPGTTGPVYEYTPGGRLDTRAWRRPGTDSQPILTRYTYGFNDLATDDEHGDLVAIEYSSNDPAATPAVAYAYDRQGRRSHAVCGGITTSLSYDDAGHQWAEEYSGGILHGVQVSWAYEGLQRASLSVGGIGGTYEVSYGYDSAGRLLAVNSGAVGAVYGYLANSPLVSQVVFTNSGATSMTTTRQYDTLNRLTQISTVDSGLRTVDSRAYVYTNSNQRIRATLADGSYWIYTYDALGQVTSGKRFWQDGTPVAGQQYEYAFDDIGNRTRMGTGGDQAGANLRYQDYARNRLNQYASRTVPGYAQVLGSANANATVSLWADTGAWAQTSRKGEYFRGELSFANNNGPVYASVNNVASLTNGSSPDIVTNVAGSLFVPATPEAFDYDDDGNLTSDGRWNYTWDAENRLVKMAPSTAVGPQNSIGFAYDWQSRRIRKQVWSGPDFDGTLTSDVRFVYDGWNLIALLDSQSAILQSFVWGLDLSGTLQGAGGVGGLLFMNDLSSAIGDCAAAYDGNGNVAALVNMSGGTNCAAYEYGPFGEVVRATGPMAKANPFRFSTKYQDDESDLLYYGYRYYNASTGRWLSRDPLNDPGFKVLIHNASELNQGEEKVPYLFVENDPVRYCDYLGLDNPGCDLPPSVKETLEKVANKDCLLRACAKHDACYFKYRCTQSSWGANAAACACPLALSIIGQHNRDCAACNCAVYLRFQACASRYDGEGDRWFCPNGPNRGKTYDDYDDIPASCWEDGKKPPRP